MRLQSCFHAAPESETFLEEPNAGALPGHGDVASPVRQDIDPVLLQNTRSYLVGRLLKLNPKGELLTAWEQFYRIYNPVLRRFAIRCYVPKASLDDCIQQVWFELVRKLRDFKFDPARGRFSSWLYRLVRSRAIDLLRNETSHATETLPAQAAARLPSREADPAISYECRSQREAVHGVLAELQKQISERSYRVLHLRWIEGRTVTETAACLGLKPAQVWCHEHRMKQKFLRLFGRDG